MPSLCPVGCTDACARIPWRYNPITNREEKQVPNFRFVCMAVLISHVFIYTHRFPSIVVFIILLQEEEERVHKCSDSQRGKESWGGGWARNYSQSQSIGNWKRTKERNILLTEARKIKIIMELRFLMTGSWWPPAQVRVVQEPTGSSTVRRRASPYN